tara:strand:- start:274 stop:1635 length:1362 start_codon:yes stop_codon:yes gene_type:complete
MAYTLKKVDTPYAPEQDPSCGKWIAEESNHTKGNVSTAGTGCSIHPLRCKLATTASGRSDCGIGDGTLSQQGNAWQPNKTDVTRTVGGQFPSDAASGRMGTPSGKRVDDITSRMGVLPRVGNTGSLRNWPPPTPPVTGPARRILTTPPDADRSSPAHIRAQGARARSAMLRLLTDGWRGLRGRRSLGSAPTESDEGRDIQPCVFNATDPWKCCNYTGHPAECCRGHPLCVQPIDSVPFRWQKFPRNVSTPRGAWWYCPGLRDAGNVFLYPIRKLAQANASSLGSPGRVPFGALDPLFTFPEEHRYARASDDVTCYALNVGVLAPWFWVFMLVVIVWLSAENYVVAWFIWMADARDALLWHANPDWRRYKMETSRHDDEDRNEDKRDKQDKAAEDSQKQEDEEDEGEPKKASSDTDTDRPRASLPPQATALRVVHTSSRAHPPHPRSRTPMTLL